MMGTNWLNILLKPKQVTSNLVRSSSLPEHQVKTQKILPCSAHCLAAVVQNTKCNSNQQKTDAKTLRKESKTLSNPCYPSL